MKSVIKRAADTAGGGHGHEGDHDDHHVLDLKVYMGVYGALLVLTVVTVGVSFAGLGKLSIPVAMAVAVVKAALVVGYFMHLKYETRLHSLVFFSSFIFLAIFFSLTMFDLAFRGGSVRETGNAVYEEQQNAVEYERALESGEIVPGHDEHGEESGGH